MKVGVIVNPVAGGGRMRRLWPAAERALVARFGSLLVRRTGGQGEAARLAAELVGEGVDMLVSAGGDGTVSEVVNGLVDVLGKRAHEIGIGIIPAGTGSDLARGLGIDGDVDSIAAGIAERPGRRVDLGRLEFTGPDGGPTVRHFVNIASLGISAEIAAAANASRKRLLSGKLLFAWHTLKELMRFRPGELIVRVDGEEVFRGRSPLVAIANNQSFAGGMRIAPDALLDDGQFDVVVVRDAGRSRLVGALRRVYDGSHRTLDICSFHRGREIEVDALAGQLGLEADGEPSGSAPLRCRLLPAAITLRW